MIIAKTIWEKVDSKSFDFKKIVCSKALFYNQFQSFFKLNSKGRNTKWNSCNIFKTMECYIFANIIFIDWK